MSTRKDFLQSSALAAIAPSAVPSAAAPAPSPSNRPAPHPTPSTFPPLAFDPAAFDAATTKSDPARRHMFASVKIADGVVLDVVKTTLDIYATTEMQTSGITAAVVLYHGASIALAFDDDVWRELFVPGIAHVHGSVRSDLASYKTAKGNPFRTAHSADETTVDEVLAKGTLFFVCNRATQGFATFLAPIVKSTPKAVYQRMAAGLLPGAALVPAGVWAIHALQDRHFTYQQVTL